MDPSKQSETDSVGSVNARSNALERVSDAVLTLDEHNRYTYVNELAAGILGSDADSLLGEHIWDGFPTSRGTQLRDAIERASRLDRSINIEWHDPGLDCWFEGRLYSDETGLSLFFDEATEQRTRQRDLERAETLFQNAQDGLFVIDVEEQGERFRVNRVNHAYEALTDTSTDELRGKTLRDLANEDERAAVRERYEKCMREREELRYEERLSVFGDKVQWETRISPVIIDDEVVQLVGSTRNITEEKERESQLRKYEQIVQQTGHAVFSTDADGVIQYVNPAFEKMTGYTSGEALGETPSLLSSGEHDDAFFADLWETVLGGDVWNGEIVNERKDGTQFTTRHTIAPVTDESGAVTNFVAIYDDITERKEREEELREKTRALDKAPIGISIVDPSQTDEPLTYVNEEYTEITGYEKDEAIGRNCRFLQGQETDSEQVAQIREAVDKANPVEVTLRNYRKDGTEFWNQLSVAPVRDEDGTLESFVGFQKDVTERREREAEMQTHLVQAQEVGHVGSWYLEIEEGALSWSDECYRIFGQDPDQPMTYDRFLEFIHPDDRENIENAWDAALDGEPYNEKHRIIVDGEIRWLHETAEVEFDDDGQPVNGIGVVRDITDQVKREQNINEQKRRYESLFNSIQDPIVVTDETGRITNGNPGLTELFGYELDELEGQPLRTLVTDNEDSLELLNQTRETKHGIRNTVRAGYQKKCGQVFTGETTISQVQNSGGDAVGFIHQIRDVSDRERNTQHLKVIDRVLRHNIRNNMNALMGHAEIVQSKGSGSVQSHVSKILEVSQDFVRMAEKQRKITTVLTDPPADDVRDIVPRVESVRTEIERHHPAADVSVSLPETCQVLATPDIDKAFRELLKNAVIHSDSEYPSVTVDVRAEDGTAAVSVSDDGPGIPESEWKIITQDAEIDQLYHGNGLGLWLVREIIRQSNGWLTFEQNSSTGSTVTVHLPTE